LLSGLSPEPTEETELVAEVEELAVVDAEELAVLFCCWICIRTPRIIDERLG
jgi:hypothetical protein